MADQLEREYPIPVPPVQFDQNHAGLKPFNRQNR